jgi:hypothetical protein
MTGLVRAYLNRADLLERLRDVVVKLSSGSRKPNAVIRFGPLTYEDFRHALLLRVRLCDLISVCSSHLPGYAGPGGVVCVSGW